MTGIVGYGTKIPPFRIKAEEIAKVWNKDSTGLGVVEKSVADLDEDAATLAVEAAQTALTSIDIEKVGAVYIGSESHPYAVKPTSSMVASVLGIGSNYRAADLEFACKAGTAAVQIVSDFVKQNEDKYGLAIGTDTAQAAPGDALEFSAACGAAAFVLGGNSSEVIATIDHTVSYSSDTPDFWRSQGSKYPSHSGRFTGEPSYFKHVVEATKLLLKETETSISDYKHVVFHMPNAAFPKKAAKMLDVTDEQLEKGFIVPNIGNTYSACSLIGLASVLDEAKPGEKILVTSYGSGSGSDSFAITVTDNILNYQRTNTVKQQINTKQYVSYPEYLTMRKKIV